MFSDDLMCPRSFAAHLHAYAVANARFRRHRVAASARSRALRCDGAAATTAASIAAAASRAAALPSLRISHMALC